MIRDYWRAFPLFSRDSWLILVASGLGGFSYQGIYFLVANLFLLRLDYGPVFIGLFVSAGALSFAVFSLVAGPAKRGFLDAAKANGKPWGALSRTEEFALKCRELGCQLFSIAGDLDYINRGIAATKSAFPNFFS